MKADGSSTLIVYSLRLETSALITVHGCLRMLKLLGAFMTYGLNADVTFGHDLKPSWPISLHVEAASYCVKILLHQDSLLHVLVQLK